MKSHLIPEPSIQPIEQNKTTRSEVSEQVFEALFHLPRPVEKIGPKDVSAMQDLPIRSFLRVILAQ